MAVSDSAASSMKTTTTYRRTAYSGSAPATSMPVTAPGTKTMPKVLVLSMAGTMASRIERQIMPTEDCCGKAPTAKAA